MASQRGKQNGGGAPPAASGGPTPAQDTEQGATAAPEAPKPAGPIPVRAKSMGFYKARRRPGTEFHIDSEKHLGSWMERLDVPAPSAAPEPTSSTEPPPASTTDQEVI